MRNDSFQLHLADGASIQVHRWMLPGEIEATLPIVDGMAGHSARSSCASGEKS